MKSLKRQLLQQARARYSKISPCTSQQSLRHCFTVEAGTLIFWFNTVDASTHILTAPLPD